MKEKNRLAVIIPGIGYHKDKPLLYYATKLVKAKGYKVICIDYSGIYKGGCCQDDGNIGKDIAVLEEVMEITERYIG